KLQIWTNLQVVQPVKVNRILQFSKMLSLQNLSRPATLERTTGNCPRLLEGLRSFASQSQSKKRQERVKKDN
uniref:Uncharacterized protein n=1 Tax=Meloidogyne incognita TaxID=6306 RepID=A0A914NUK7_MELIC